MERNEELREEFKETIDSYPQYKLYYLDECGLDKYLYRTHGYAPIGIPLYGKISGKRYKRTNIVAAKCGTKIVAPLIYDGITDSHIFEWWFENMLLKSIPKYSIIVMDNASFHRKLVLEALAEEADCEILYLPPYSPDLNPIENHWAWIKAKLRRILSLYDCFEAALLDCF